MADFACARARMVERHVRPSDVTDMRVLDLMGRVPRERFTPKDARPRAYAGDHLPVGQGRVMLDPRLLAKMLDALRIERDEVALDIGCLFGYSTMLLAGLASAVVGVEADKDMAQGAIGTLDALGVDNAAIIAGALNEGAAKHGPYHAVLINGGIETLPDAIVAQLARGGRLIAIRMGKGGGRCVLCCRFDARVSETALFDASAPILPGFARERAFSF